MNAFSQGPLVLLDLDGTLIDSAPGIVASVAHAYGVLGLPVPAADVLRSFIGPPIATSFPAHGVPPERVAEAIAAYRAEYTRAGMRNQAVFDGIPGQLRRLREAGCVLAIATSKPEVFAHPIAEQFGFPDLVDGVFGASLDERGTKAGVIANALVALGRSVADAATAAPALMVGDREYDVAGAREHGIDCLGVTWGYALPGELEAAGCAAIIDDVGALAQTVLTLLRA